MKSPWWSQIPGSSRILRDYSLARSTLYLMESWPLQMLNRVVTGRWDENFFPPPEFQEAALRAGRELLTKDAERATEGLFPISLLKPDTPFRHFRSWMGVMADGVRVALRMRTNEHQDLNHVPKEELGRVPKYYQRNFHFQSDGYFSESSARRYDHQVEILFKGGAAAMRRLTLVPLVKAFHNKNVRLLEIGAGGGSATRQVAKALPEAQIVALDLSPTYLKFAKENLSDERHVDFVQGDATNLDFKDETFDGAFSVFLYHELPKSERSKSFAEAFRALKPGGIYVVVDSLQWDDVPALNWGLERFPKDFHEPFYKNYVKNQLKDLMQAAGFKVHHQEFGLLAKCVAGVKPASTKPNS